MNLPTTEQVKTVGLHAVSMSIGAVGALAFFKVLSGSDPKNAVDAINQISHGVGEVVAGLSTLAGIAMMAWRAIKNGPLGILLKAASVSLPSGKNPIIVADAPTAQATPSVPNIVPNVSAATAAVQRS